MEIRKILMWLILLGSIVFLAMLFVQRLQAKSFNDLVSHIKEAKTEAAIARRIRLTKTFAVGPQGLTTVDGIAHVPGIEAAWAIGITGNDLGTLDEGAFEGPRFKNLTLLDLSSNKIRTIKPGALRLENLRILFLNNNTITSLNDDVFKETPKLKIIGIGGNPPQGDQALREIVKKKLPNAYVYSGGITLQFVRRALAVGTAVSVAIAAAIIYYLFKRQRPETIDGDFRGLEEGTVTARPEEAGASKITWETEDDEAKLKKVYEYFDNPTQETEAAAKKSLEELRQRLREWRTKLEGEEAKKRVRKEAEEEYVSLLKEVSKLEKRMKGPLYEKELWPSIPEEEEEIRKIREQKEKL